MAASRLSVHQRIRFRRPSGQGLRPHLGRGRRPVFRAAEARLSPEAARRLRDAGTTNRVVIAGETRGPDAGHAGQSSKSAPRARDQGHRLRAGRLPLEERQGRGAAARPVGRHRAGRRRRRQQGRRRRRPGHHVRLCLPRDAGADAGADLLRAQDPRSCMAEARTSGKEQDARPRRQEPGHACAMQNGKPVAATQIVRLDPAHRRDADLATTCAEIVEPYVQKALPEGWITQETRLARQPDRQVRDRRPGRRLRPHRPQDHRRHLWRRGAAWRRRVLGQGPDQGRPLGRLCRALSRQERGRGGPRRPLHHPALLRDRRVASRCRSMSTCTAPARSTRPSSRRRCRELMDLHAARHPQASGPQQADLCPHLGLRPFRPRARQGRRLLLGEDRPRRQARKAACAERFRRVIETGRSAGGRYGRHDWPTTRQTDEKHERGRGLFRPAQGPQAAAGPDRLMAELLPALALDLRSPLGSARAVSGPGRAGPARDRLRRRRASAARGAAQSRHRLHRLRALQNGMAQAARRIEARGPGKYPPALRRRTRPARLAAGGLASSASIFSIPIPGPSGATGSAASSPTRRVARLRAFWRRAASSASPPTSTSYVGWTLAALAPRAGFRLDRRAGRRLALPWAGWPGTRYEAKALAVAESRPILRFRAPCEGLAPRAACAIFPRQERTSQRDPRIERWRVGPDRDPLFFVSPRARRARAMNTTETFAASALDEPRLITETGLAARVAAIASRCSRVSASVWCASGSPAATAARCRSWPSGRTAASRSRIASWRAARCRRRSTSRIRSRAPTGSKSPRPASTGRSCGARDFERYAGHEVEDRDGRAGRRPQALPRRPLGASKAMRAKLRFETREGGDARPCCCRSTISPRRSSCSPTTLVAQSRCEARQGQSRAAKMNAVQRHGRRQPPRSRQSRRD